MQSRYKLVYSCRSLALRIPLVKATVIVCLAKMILRSLESVSHRQWEVLLGHLAFLAPLSEEARYRKKMLGPVLKEWENRAWRTENLPRLQSALRFWCKLENFCVWEPLRKPRASLTFWTDASLSGWGAHSDQGRTLQGSWYGKDIGKHINVLETLAVARLVESEWVPCGSSIAVYTDNRTAFHAINKQGSSRSLQVTEAYGELREILLRKQIHVEMFRVAGKQNVLADSLSRGVAVSTEWELNPVDFAWISEAVPGLEIDMMATPFNAKLPLFISPFDHARAVGTDALSVDWNRWRRIYIFPPEALLAKVLLKMESFKGLAGE